MHLATCFCVILNDAATDNFGSKNILEIKFRNHTSVGAGSLKILTGVLVHRVTRPLRGSVSCGSGWSVPCVSIQLTLSQTGILTGVLVHRVTRPLRGSVSCGSGQLGMRSRVSFLADLLANRQAGSQDFTVPPRAHPTGSHSGSKQASKQTLKGKLDSSDVQRHRGTSRDTHERDTRQTQEPHKPTSKPTPPTDSRARPHPNPGTHVRRPTPHHNTPDTTHP